MFIGKDKSFSTPAWFLVAFQSFLRLKTLARLTAAMEHREFSAFNELLGSPWRQKLGGIRSIFGIKEGGVMMVERDKPCSLSYVDGVN